jgi:hypothetical protein
MYRHLGANPDGAACFLICTSLMSEHNIAQARLHQQLCPRGISFGWKCNPALLYLPYISVPFIHKQCEHSVVFSLSQPLLFCNGGPVDFLFRLICTFGFSTPIRRHVTSLQCSRHGQGIYFGGPSRAIHTDITSLYNSIASQESVACLWW